MIRTMPKSQKRPHPIAMPMKYFLLQCALFLIQLFLWIFFHTWFFTVPVAFVFVCFSLWAWYQAEH
jgi:hypothetical protein